MEWELHPVDILAGDQLPPEFLTLNPNNKTPVIVDHDGPDGGDFVLAESGAILIYLAEKAGRLIPDEPRARSRCFQWLMFQMSGIGPMFGQAVHFTHYAAERHEYPIARYTREVDRLLMVLNGRLGEAEWLAGQDYSIADIATLPFLRRILIERGGEFPDIERWATAMLARPAVEKGMAVGVARKEVVEGGLQGFTDEHREILWGDRQHRPR